MNGLLGLLSRLTLGHVANFGIESSIEMPSEVTYDKAIGEANVVTSKRDKGNMHALLLDIDVPAYLVPSSREGHSHLYIDVVADTAAYMNLLDALAACGVIEEGYASASRKRGMTVLRLPWVKKSQGKPASIATVTPISNDPWGSI